MCISSVCHCFRYFACFLSCIGTCLNSSSSSSRSPVKKVLCIILLSVFQRCFDDGGLFLVMDAGLWLLFLWPASG